MDDAESTETNVDTQALRQLIKIRFNLDQILDHTIKQKHHLQSIRTWIAVLATLYIVGSIIVLLAVLNRT